MKDFLESRQWSREPRDVLPESLREYVERVICHARRRAFALVINVYNNSPGVPLSGLEFVLLRPQSYLVLVSFDGRTDDEEAPCAERCRNHLG